MIEIDLKENGRTLFEYESPAVPRIGERMSLDVDEDKGDFLVSNVEHHVFRDKRGQGEILTYAIVSLERITLETTNTQT